MIHRRDFLALTAAATIAVPLRAFAQAPQMKRLGFSFTLAENDPQTPNYVDPMRANLAAEGWQEGRNLLVDYRWGPGLTTDIASKYAAELAALKPDVLLPIGSVNVLAAAQQTRTIPIVFGLFADPQLGGLVQNLAHPEGNITGFVNFDGSLGAKWLDLLLELIPQLKTVGFPVNPATPVGGASLYPALAQAAQKAGIEALQLMWSTPADLTARLTDLAGRPSPGLILSNDSSLLNVRTQLYADVARLHVPAVWGHVIYGAEGAPVVYSIDQFAQVASAGTYAGRVLNGAKIVDLPVQLPSKYLLTINLKTAKEQDLAIPQTLLVRADQVIS